METLALPPSTRLVAPRPARGEPPLCSKTIPLGPPSAKAWGHWPTVWASRSNARATAAAVHPCASNKSGAIAPVPEVSALGTSVAVPQPRPCATSPATLPSPACPTTPSAFSAHYLNRLHFYSPLMPVSPWFRFSRMDSPQHSLIRDSDTGKQAGCPGDPEEPPTLSRHRHSPSWPKSRRGLATDRPFKSNNYHGRVRTRTSQLAGRGRRSMRRRDETSGLNCWTNSQDRTIRYPTA